jgi:hypothetical protein
MTTVGEPPESVIELEPTDTEALPLVTATLLLVFVTTDVDVEPSDCVTLPDPGLSSLFPVPVVILVVEGIAVTPGDADDEDTGPVVVATTLNVY